MEGLNDKLFVSKIIQDKSIAEVMDVPAKFIQHEEYRKAYKYIQDYFRDHGEIPTVRVMQADCPKAVLMAVDEPWTVIISRVRAQYKNQVINEGMARVVEYQEANDPDGAATAMAALVGRLHNDLPTSRDVDVTANGDERLARYLHRKNNPGEMVGIPSGFPTIDKATQGFQPGQLITLTGLPKASKSAIALLMAKYAQEYGKRVLYITFEMTCEEQEERLDAYRAGINDMKLLSGNLTEDEFRKVTLAVHETENLPPLVFSEDCMTVTAIGAKIDLMKPDIVIVDGVYMMEDEEGFDKGSPQALANIVSNLKFMAMNREICIIDVTQSTPARTKGETLNNDSMMGSRSFAQYSNVVIGVERTDDVQIRILKVIMTRRGVPCSVKVFMDFNTGTFEEMPEDSLDSDDRELEDDEDTEGYTAY